jgi:N-methylhydantoinase A/oxoprolinase/acetone carboxylase beta subunit
LHLREFGYSREAEPVELVTIRVRVTAPAAGVAAKRRRARAGTARAGGAIRALVGRGRVREVPVYPREDLVPGIDLKGPAIVTEYSATTWVAPGFRAGLDPLGLLVIRSGGGGGE